VIKLACVGDSITQGEGTAYGMSWPNQIAKMLGAKWKVKNFGMGGTTLLNSGDHPYQGKNVFKYAKEFNPDVVVIMLGTNDTKNHNWKNKAKFEGDYIDLIIQFATLPSKPRIFICYPPYVAGDLYDGTSESKIEKEIPMINKVAKTMNVGIIDVHGALKGKGVLIPDRVHPNTEGAIEIAKTVYKVLIGKPFVGIQIGPWIINI